MAAGDFTASAMPDIVVRATEMWADPRTKYELMPDTGSAKAVLSSQLAQFEPVMRGAKCIGVSAAWLKSCVDTVTDLTSSALTDCVLTGNEFESAKLTYAPTINSSYGFTVYDDECKDLYEWTEKMAFGILKSKAALRKDLNSKVLAFLFANRTQNLYTGTTGTIVTAGSQHTEFDAAYWTPDLIAEFDITRTFNQMSDNSYFISGTNLKNAQFNAMYNSANADQKDEILKLGHFPLYFDVRNVDAATSAKSTFMVDPSALAFFAWNQFSNTAPENTLDPYNTHTYQDSDPEIMYRNGNSMVPLTYDVEMQRVCKRDSASAGIRHGHRWGWVVNYFLRGGLILGPGDCAGGKGIIEFRNVSS